MNVSEELDRLAKLHAEGMLTSEEFASAKRRALSSPSAGSIPGFVFRSIRRESARTLFGLPLWSIAVGPDLERGEIRGHARGIFALGDMATGCFALGGLARGVVAMGGLAIGLVSIGGGSIGIAAALGGAALGGFAIGGAAVGFVAVGGVALGYYAFGGVALGAYTVSALHQDPEAVRVLERYLPWLTRLLRR